MCLRGVELALGLITVGLTVVRDVQVRKLFARQVEDRQDPEHVSLDGEQYVRDWVNRCGLVGEMGKRTVKNLSVREPQLQGIAGVLLAVIPALSSFGMVAFYLCTALIKQVKAA